MVIGSNIGAMHDFGIWHLLNLFDTHTWSIWFSVFKLGDLQVALWMRLWKNASSDDKVVDGTHVCKSLSMSLLFLRVA